MFQEGHMKSIPPSDNYLLITRHSARHYKYTVNKRDKISACKIRTKASTEFGHSNYGPPTTGGFCDLFTSCLSAPRCELHKGGDFCLFCSLC